MKMNSCYNCEIVDYNHDSSNKDNKNGDISASFQYREFIFGQKKQFFSMKKFESPTNP
jgi:hypothetical protein